MFRVNTGGTGFTVLHQFTAWSDTNSGFAINGDGASPNGLILSGDRLYGTAGLGGEFGQGTVFAVNVDGSGFTTLHSFTAASFTNNYINSDGVEPESGLILSGNMLYEQRLVVELSATEQCLPFARMAQALRFCIISITRMVQALGVWFCGAIFSAFRQPMAAILVIELVPIFKPVSVENKL